MNHFSLQPGGEIAELCTYCVERGGLSAEEARAWMVQATQSPEAQSELLAIARAVRDRALPDREVAFCGIFQAKLGGCAEDCAFCCQSSHHKAMGSKSRPMASTEELMNRARTLASMGARAFSIVTAGRRLKDPADIDVVCRVVEQVSKELGLETCASLGRIPRSSFRRLSDAGLSRYHHNLEAAPSFFPELITTYRIEESIETMALAREAGLAICSSGVFGAGESDEQRVELIALLRDLGVEGLPICFLEPHQGTPLGDRPLLDAEVALRIIALHRLMMPRADIIVTGGRLLVLGEGQGAVYDAGANGVMVGDYPTTFGGELEADHKAVRERGFIARRPYRK